MNYILVLNFKHIYTPYRTIGSAYIRNLWDWKVEWWRWEICEHQNIILSVIPGSKTQTWDSDFSPFLFKQTFAKRIGGVYLAGYSYIRYFKFTRDTWMKSFKAQTAINQNALGNKGYSDAQGEQGQRKKCSCNAGISFLK